MVGLDTNVLVRSLTRDDPEPYRAAKAFIESTCTQEKPGLIGQRTIPAFGPPVTWVASLKLGGVTKRTTENARPRVGTNSLTAAPPYNDRSMLQMRIKG